MEICKHEPNSADHQRTNQTAQTRTSTVDWRGAPAYKLARLFTPKIRQLAPLPNTYNLKNTTDLITKLKDTPILPQFTLASLDITNLYINVPVTESREIIAKALKNNIPNPQIRDELINW